MTMTASYSPGVRAAAARRGLTPSEYLAIVAAWIHNNAFDDTPRRALAQALGLPEPR